MSTTKRFTENEKFITLGNLERFLEKVQTYVAAADKVTDDKVTALETVVGNEASGLVQKVNLIQGELDGLSGGAGSITTQITNALSGLDVTDTEVDGQYVSAVSETDGKITVTRKALPVYETSGAAADALAEAKSYTDTLANGAVAANTAALAELTGSGENSVNSKVAAAIAGVVANAPDNLDTLKEIADYIAADPHGVAELSNKVTANETAIKALQEFDHSVYAEKTSVYTKGEIDTAVEGAKNAAIADADTKLATKANAADVYVKTDVDTAIANAKAAAIADADAKLALKANASDVYTKTEIAALFESNSAADQAYAKQYTDALFDSFNLTTNDEIDALFE